MSVYQVSLDVFEGPLDLLLRLIEREELDITLVSLAIVADQYLAHISELRDPSPANLADFLVIAARLVLLKSRVLLPRPQEETREEDDDWGEDLVERLAEYKRFKVLAAKLREMEDLGLRAYARLAPAPGIERRLEPGDVSVQELAEAFRRALEAHPPTPPVDDVLSPVVVRMADCVENILSKVRRYRRIRFATLMARARSRIEVIVTFLAMLELIKQQRLRATQERPFGEIHLERRDPDPDAAIPPTDLREYGEPES